MKFALVYSYDPTEANPTEGEVSDWIAVAEAIEKAGVHVSEAGFQPPERARRISKRNGSSSSRTGR